MNHVVRFAKNKKCLNSLNRVRAENETLWIAMLPLRASAPCLSASTSGLVRKDDASSKNAWRHNKKSDERNTSLSFAFISFVLAQSTAILLLCVLEDRFLICHRWLLVLLYKYYTSSTILFTVPKPSKHKNTLYKLHYHHGENRNLSLWV